MTGVRAGVRPEEMFGADAAVRTDPATSITEIAGFFGAGPERLFGSLVLPLGEPTGCVLISSSLYAELARNYRREVILARELAARGIASLRYHYRGTGYSDGDPAALAFASMCGDATSALALVQERCPGVPSGFVGTRLGGLVAATATRTMPSAPLVLWDPISSVGHFLVDATKARKAGGMVAGKQVAAAPTEQQQDDWAEGFMDSLGYRLPRGLRDSFDGVSLSDCLGVEGRNVLILSVVARHDRFPRAKEVADLLRERTGSAVDLRTIDGRLSWWTERDWWDPDEEDPPTIEMVAGSVDWLERRLAREAAS